MDEQEPWRTEPSTMEELELEVAFLSAAGGCPLPVGSPVAWAALVEVWRRWRSGEVLL